MKENWEFAKKVEEERHYKQREQYKQRCRNVKQLDVFRGTTTGLTGLEHGVLGDWSKVWSAH